MKNLLCRSCATAAILFAGAVQADISANISLTSDYRFRGITQSAEESAVQGGLEYSHDSGLYAGTWLSSVDYYAAGDAFDNNESVEHDFYIGYFGEINELLTYDITLYQYLYPGAEESSDYNEIVLGADYKSLRIAYWYTDDYFGIGENYSYLEGNYTVSLPDEFGLAFHLGYSFGDALDPDVLGFDEYVDYSIAIDKNFAGLDISLVYTSTNISNTFKVDNGFNANQEALVFSISKSF